MIHNHGTEDGPGLSCAELPQPDGTLMGRCLARPACSCPSLVAYASAELAWPGWDPACPEHHYLTVRTTP